MSRSDDAVQGRRGDRASPILSLSRYDLILLVIPAALLVGLVSGYLLSVSLETALLVGSTIGGVALLDALFVNPPIRPDSQ